jgi:uncharacterized membrane protein YdjX (TVP38/TMEM64 family)
MNRWLGVAAFTMIVISIAVLIAIGPPAGGVEHLREVLLSWGPWSMLVSAAMMIAQAVIAPLPANVITITNGLVFGPIRGALLSWLSMLLGSSICFLLAKTLGKPFAVRFAGKSLERAEGFFRQYGLPAVFIVRIMPFVPFDAVSFGAGVVGVPYLRFLLATAIGIIPSVFVYSYIGSKIADAYWFILIAALSASLIGFAVASRFWRRPATTTVETHPA